MTEEMVEDMTSHEGETEKYTKLLLENYKKKKE